MKKIALTVLVLVLLLAGIGAGVYLIRRQTEFREKAAPSSTLALVPSKSNPQIDETFTVSANINTGSNNVLAAELHVTFDETKVEAVGAANGTFFTAPKNVGPSIDNNNGTLTYTVYIDPGTPPRQGEGVVAILTFKAKAAGNTTVALSSETNVGADNSTNDLGINVLTGTTPAILTIEGQSEASPTPTSGVSGSPTPTLHTTATRTPTPTTIANVSAATNTVTPRPTVTVTSATGQPVLPDSGISTPTTLGIGVGVLVIVGSLLLAL